MTGVIGRLWSNLSLEAKERYEEVQRSQKRQRIKLMEEAGLPPSSRDIETETPGVSTLRFYARDDAVNAPVQADIDGGESSTPFVAEPVDPPRIWFKGIEVRTFLILCFLIDVESRDSVRLRLNSLETRPFRSRRVKLCSLLKGHQAPVFKRLTSRKLRRPFPPFCIIPSQPMLTPRTSHTCTRALCRPSLIVFRSTPRSTPTHIHMRPAHLRPRSVQDWKILHRPHTLWTMDLLQVLPPSQPRRIVALSSIPARGRTQPQPHR